MTKTQQLFLLKKVREITEKYQSQKISHEDVYDEIWRLAEDEFTWLMTYVLGMKKGDQIDNLFVLLLIFEAATNEPESESHEAILICDRTAYLEMITEKMKQLIVSEGIKTLINSGKEPESDE